MFLWPVMTCSPPNLTSCQQCHDIITSSIEMWKLAGGRHVHMCGRLTLSWLCDQPVWWLYLQPLGVWLGWVSERTGHDSCTFLSEEQAKVSAGTLAAWEIIKIHMVGWSRVLKVEKCCSSVVLICWYVRGLQHWCLKSRSQDLKVGLICAILDLLCWDHYMWRVATGPRCFWRDSSGLLDRGCRSSTDNIKVEQILLVVSFKEDKEKNVLEVGIVEETRWEAACSDCIERRPWVNEQGAAQWASQWTK